MSRPGGVVGSVPRIWRFCAPVSRVRFLARGSFSIPSAFSRSPSLLSLYLLNKGKNAPKRVMISRQLIVNFPDYPLKKCYQMSISNLNSNISLYFHRNVRGHYVLLSMIKKSSISAQEIQPCVT